MKKIIIGFILIVLAVLMLNEIGGAVKHQYSVETTWNNGNVTTWESTNVKRW